MPELLLELGTEELPASAVQRAYTELADRIVAQLAEAGLVGADAAPTTLGTPRRLIVSVPAVAARQPDSTKEQRGPGLKSAYDERGEPTPALLGFCRSQGVEPSELRNDGQYVWLTKQTLGRRTSELLADVLPKAIRALTFDKTMRWGTSRLRFARPIRWILATFAGQVVPFEIEGVSSGFTSYGHRTYSPGSFEAVDLQSLLDGLRQRHVEPDPAKRRETILVGAKAVVRGEPDLPHGLVDENVFLTEWPTAIAGSFSEAFLELPEVVLATAMAKHEKMFPVRNPLGEMDNSFVFIRNSGEDDTVRKGCEWVLNARFNDAKFFFDEDKRYTLEQFLERTSGIVFQERLGTVRQRAERLSELARVAVPGPDSELELAKCAGRLAKADLSTGLVSELASLQGIIGGDYARREGHPEEVCWAIATQYDLAKNPEADSVGARTAIRLVLADQLDKLVGYLGIGLEPTGSSDPFALRRAASLLIDLAWTWPQRLAPYSSMLTHAALLYRIQDLKLDEQALVDARLANMFATRYPAMMVGVRHDVLQAALLEESASEVTDPQGVRFRVKVLEALAQDVPLIQAATRPLNILTAARKKGIEFGGDKPLARLEHSALESASGLELFETVSAQNEAVLAAQRSLNDGELIRLIRALQAPINRFFDETMVMADEPDVRYARLTLMNAVAEQLYAAGDFAKLVIEGEVTSPKS